MKAIIALQTLIKEEEKRLGLLKRQLADHESGENKLTYMAKASTESSLEECSENLTKHTEQLNELMAKDLKELEEQERLEEAVKRKNYFHWQKVRLKRDKVRTNDQKVEAMLIMDELPEDLQFEDDALFSIAEKSLELNLSLHEGMEEKLTEIKTDFENLLKDIKEEDIQQLELLNYRIPILILHFYVLIENIKENIERDNEKAKARGEKEKLFSGLPRYEDWWINELWESHQAYISLFKWKYIISNICTSNDLQRAWNSIFSNWIFVKKLLNSKGKQAYEYTFAFDALVRKYGELEEELDLKNIKSMEKIIAKLTENEDFKSVKKDHSIGTKYLSYKKSKLNHKKK
ncbi:MAG: hypothetical protein U9Q04_02475 [Campylobacterota bacterium]|nr:hypothetical protein [Campylobacterota bacterium]